MIDSDFSDLIVNEHEKHKEKMAEYDERRKRQREALLWNIERSAKALIWHGLEVDVVVKTISGKKQPCA